MADQEQLSILKDGVAVWNSWRKTNSTVPVDLSGADLNGLQLQRVNLRSAYLSQAILVRSDLSNADLNCADLAGAYLHGVNFSGSDLSESILDRVECMGARFTGANVSNADLSDGRFIAADFNSANLSGSRLGASVFINATFRSAVLRGSSLLDSSLVGCDFTHADLSGSHVYGTAVWSVILEGANQSGLRITRPDESPVQVDSLEVAQFIYLLLNNQKIRHVIDTITSKVVLILGRFTPERKAILDAIRNELRKRDYTPVLFDFEKPSNRDITETVSTLAHMARFVIADITDAKSIPQELMAIVPSLPSVPVQPLLLAKQREYGMFEHFKRFPWVLEPYLFDDQDCLLATINDTVIGPAEAKAKEQTAVR